MTKFLYKMFGFLGFLIASCICSFLVVIAYSQISEKNVLFISFILIIVNIFSAFILAVLDYFRRKIMIDKPLNEILDATERITKGDFNVKLVSSHPYKYIDEFDLIKENINRMVNELSKNEVLKNDFISNVSHEIKTPLSVIQSYSNALKDETLPKDKREKYLDNLQENCKKLTNLVANILRLNKLENQRLLPEFERFNLSELLITQIVQFEELIDKKNIELVCNIEEDLFIENEKSYLELVFNNLISNAIKFTNDKGKIEISLKRKEKEYIIEFKDSGCGMDSETGRHIFDKFYQGDTSHSKEGNGLGLALVKRVIDIIGGSISVESEIGVGTTFTIAIKGE